jgi:hypothetical protein
MKKSVSAHTGWQPRRRTRHQLYFSKETCCPDPAVAVALELVADGADPGDEVVPVEENERRVVEGRSCDAHQLAPSLDRNGAEGGDGGRRASWPGCMLQSPL